MHRHPSDPIELKKLLPRFTRGEFVLKKGWGVNTDVYHGQIAELEIPYPTVKKLRIHPAKLTSRRIGCDGDDRAVNRWDSVELVPEHIDFDYSWYYTQPHHERIKLEYVIRDTGKKPVFFSRRIVTTDRCWLCSSDDPMYLDHFREMFLEMFMKESKARESRIRALRNRLLS